MITFDSLTLKAFVEENKEFLTGARIQKIQQPTRRDFVFTVRKSGDTRKLYININPQQHHVCFMSKENEIKRRIKIPQKPPMFCMLLRKYLENAQIYRVNQPVNERILELYFETYNELNEQIYLCLAIELMGKHSNVILYNYDTNIILGCAHNVGAEKSREREMAGTLPYIYPPKQSKINIQDYNGDINYDKLSLDFYMFSKAFSDLCRGKSLSELRNYAALKNVNPAISFDYKIYSLFEELIPEAVLQKNVNEMIDNYFAYHQETEQYKNLKIHLLSLSNQRLKKINNSIEKIQSQISREINCDKYRLYGDLIMANLYLGKDYSENIEVYDYENSKNILINLDSSKSLKENANIFYKLYTKGKTSRQKLMELKFDLLQIKKYLEQIEYSIYSSNTIEDLLEIKPELVAENKNITSNHKAVEPVKIVKDGFTIFIGRNNRQNDYIVSKLAKENDLWFHTKDCAGSHVLLKGENPDDEIILECAKLAKDNSSGAKSSKVGVIYTLRKYLKKPPKANLGLVIYRNEKEIIID